MIYMNMSPNNNLTKSYEVSLLYGGIREAGSKPSRTHSNTIAPGFKLFRPAWKKYNCKLNLDWREITYIEKERRKKKRPKRERARVKYRKENKN